MGARLQHGDFLGGAAMKSWIVLRRSGIPEADRVSKMLVVNSGMDEQTFFLSYAEWHNL